MNIETCRDILHSEDLTCVVADETEILLRSSRKSILPMLDVLKLYNNGRKPLYQADKIIGKAAVIIAHHCGVREIYADVLSRSALDYAERRDITVSYDSLVEMVLNRTGTAEGPFEAALRGIDEDDFDLVMKTVYQTLDALGIRY